MLNLSDHELIKEIKKESDLAFSYLYEHHFKIIENLVLKNSGSFEDAKDLFQESIIILFNNIKKPDFRLSSKLSTYIYSIARNKWLKELRDNNKMKTQEIIETQGYEEGFVFELSEEEERETLMLKQFSLLETHCQTILKLFYFKELKLKKIAEIMGYTESFAKQKKFRCMQFLKKKMKLVHGNLF